MRREKARVLLEHRLQKLLLEYIHCWEQYCRIMRRKQTSLPSLQQLDKFIIILQTLRKLLQTMAEETK